MQEICVCFPFYRESLYNHCKISLLLIYRFINNILILYILHMGSTYFFLEIFSGILQRRQWHPTPVLLPGKPHGWKSLAGCSPWGRTESDTIEVTYQRQQQEQFLQVKFFGKQLHIKIRLHQTHFPLSSSLHQ